jgi:hypothetical protein
MNSMLRYAIYLIYIYLFRWLISGCSWFCVFQMPHTYSSFNQHELCCLFLFNQQVFVSYYPTEVRLLWKSCWARFLWAIFFLSVGFCPRSILFNLPAAALEVTSVQIYTLYHGWHVDCVSVYLKPSSNCFLLIICDFFFSLSQVARHCVFLMQSKSYPLFLSLIPPMLVFQRKLYGTYRTEIV